VPVSTLAEPPPPGGAPGDVGVEDELLSSSLHAEMKDTMANTMTMNTHTDLTVLFIKKFSFYKL
jgi:hypothetical protein